MASEALAAREASLADSQASLQAELDGLLAKQEERLRSWEAGCAELEAALEARRGQLDGEEARCAIMPRGDEAGAWCVTCSLMSWHC
jgi:hypothetical protein